ncbi:hypothetical protein GLYMA_02G109166v4 [Glycine max]|nr:hypothetical protein GLYMA_02G109166v4 [Glycine max]KAH1059777.1 hypothetical protein GYH30_003665 [Glycine max]|eukprot:XP_014628489.1 replication initiator 1-like [Glycine max]
MDVLVAATSPLPAPAPAPTLLRPPPGSSQNKTASSSDETSHIICDKCDPPRPFKSEQGLNSHSRIHKRPIQFDILEFKCGECTDVFESQQALSGHMRVHNRVRYRPPNARP